MNTIHSRFDALNYGYIPGLTVIPKSITWKPGGPSHPGILIAARLSPTDKLRSVTSLARTLSHEIGHYLMDTPEHPVGTPWNIMDGETDDAKRDLTWDQARALDVATDQPDQPIGG